MRPDLAARLAEFGNLRDLESAKLLPAGGRCIHQGHAPPFVFAETIESAIRIGQRASAERPLLGPDHVAARPLLAYPTLAVGVAVEVSADQDHAPLLVDHGLVGIDLVGFELLSRWSEFDQVTAGPGAGGDVNLAIVKNRRWNNN